MCQQAHKMWIEMLREIMMMRWRGLLRLVIIVIDGRMGMMCVLSRRGMMVFMPGIGMIVRNDLADIKDRQDYCKKQPVPVHSYLS